MSIFSDASHAYALEADIDSEAKIDAAERQSDLEEGNMTAGGPEVVEGVEDTMAGGSDTVLEFGVFTEGLDGVARIEDSWGAA